MGGAGGFGAGGGGGATGGTSDGGLGGTGGSSASGFSNGGGGAALGGAFFVGDGGTLTVSGNLTGTYTVTGGTTGGAGGATAGQAQGSVMYLRGSGTTTMDVASGTRTFAGNDAIAGSGALGKSGAGILALTGSNTNFTGGVTVTGGLVNFASAGSLGSGAISLNGGGLQWATGNTTDISMRLTPLGTGGGTIDTNGNEVTFATGLAGTGGLTKTGEGKLTLTSNNTHAGGTTVEAGTLALTSTAFISGALTVNGGVFDISAKDDVGVTSLSGTGGTIRLGSGTILTVTSNSNTTSASTIIGNGGLTKQGTGTLTLTGTSTYSGSTAIYGGTVSISENANLGTGAIVMFNSTLQTTGDIRAERQILIGGTSTFDTATGTTFTSDGFVNGNGRLLKSGGGTMVLGGFENYYTGGTTIEAGTLSISSDKHLGGASSGISFAGTGGTLRTTANVTTSRTVSLASAGGTFETATGTQLVLNGEVSGTNGLTKTGEGTLVLGGNNTYAGGTTVNAGTLQLATGARLAFGGALTVNGATFDLNGNTQTVGTLSGTGGTIALGNGSLTTESSATSSLAAAITGTGSFEMRGSGTLTLSGANSYTGGTTVRVGTLRLGDGASLASTGALTVHSGTFDLNNNNQTVGQLSGSGGTIALGSGTLTTNGAANANLDSVITGGGAFVKNGSGRLLLAGANSYTGGTTVNAGTLRLGTGGSLASTGALTVNGGTFDLNSQSQTVGTLSGTGGAITLGSATLTTDSSADSSLAAAISGTGAFVKSGSGTLTLSGGNTYSGTTTIESGTLQVGNGTSTGTLGTGAITNNGTLSFNRSNSLAISGNISGSGGVQQIGTGTTVLTGTNTYSGATTIESGTLQIGNGAGTGTLGTGAIVNNGTLAFRRLGTLSVATDISGTGSVRQESGGTTTLSGNNTYSGGTLITSGVLQISADTNLGATAGGITLSGGTLRATATMTTARNISLATLGGVDVAAGTVLTASGTISGAGGFSKFGAGTLVLTGSNSYAGDTGLNAGTVAVSADNNLGNGGRLTFAGGALRYDAGFASSRAITLINPGSFVDTNGNDAALTGTISGASRLTKTGAGTLTLGGANTYAGGTRIDGGTVAVSSDANLGASSGGLLLDGGTLRTADSFNTSRNVELLGGGGTFDVVAGKLVLQANVTEGDGPGNLTKTGAGTLVLAGTADYSGTTTVSAGTLQGTTANLAGNITNNATVSFNQTADGTYAGVMSGSGRLLIEGAGTVTLAGANSYSGTTTIAAGTLSITGALGTGDVVNNGRLAFDRNTDVAAANAISGSGSLTKQGNGTLTLSGINSYTGGTTVSAGVLQGNTQSLQGDILNNAAVTFDQATNGTYAGSMSGSGMLTKSGAGTLVLTGVNSYSGTTTVSAGTLQGNSTSIQGNILNGGSVVFDQSTNGTYAGAISGSGSLTKSGNGTLTLDGANTYTGGTTVNAGTLRLSVGGPLASTGALTVTGGTFDLNDRNQTVGALSGSGGAITLGNATLTAGDANNTTLAAAISGIGSLVKQGTGTLTLTGANTHTGGTTISGGILQVGNGGTTGSLAGNLVNNGTLAFNRSDNVTFGGAISGSGALDKLGDNTLILTGNSTYSGLTTIAAGMLQLGNGATSGSITGNVLNNGVLAFNRSDDIVFGGNVDGSGAISYMGPGKVTLTGTISNTGGTVLGGTVLAGSDAALGAAGSTLTFAGGTLQATDSFTVGRPLNLITGGGTIDTAGNTLVVTGNITGAGGFTKSGDGTLVLAGTNSYSGGTTVSGGALEGDTTSLQGNILNNATVSFNQAASGTYAGTMSGTGNLIASGNGALTLTADNTYSGGTTIATGSKLSIGNGGSTGTMGSGAVTNNGELHFNRSDTHTVVSSITGVGSVFLDDGSGTTILTGNNSYTGSTRIWSGSTLQVGNGGTSGTLGTGRVQITDGTLRFDRSDTLVVASEISGNGNVVQAGSGTTALTFDSSYGGATTIEAGTLKLGNGGTTGSLGNGNIVNNATLAFDRTDALLTVAGEISGTGGIVQAGSGTTTLNGANTYSGTTTILAGKLIVGGTAGSLGTGNVVNDGILHYTRTNAYTVANDISGTGSFRLFGGGTGTLTGNNTYTGTTTVGTGTLRIGDGGAAGTLGTGGIEILFGNLQFNRSDALTVAGAISGTAGTVAQIGTGTTSLTGNGTFTGVTTISAGTLSLGDGGTTGALGTGNITNNATLQFNRSNELTVANAISGTGGVVQAGTGTTFLTGNNTYTGTTTVLAGTLSIGNGGTTGSIGAGNVINNAVLQINRSDNVTLANVISGSGGLVQAGPGTTILTGANSYSGGTLVSGGTLQGTTSSLQGNVLNNAAVVFSQAANGTYAGNMSGTGSLTLTGGGQYTLTGSNSYTGGTSLLAGALIGNSASLQGNILNNGAVTFSQTGTGTYAGIMSGSGSMTLQGGGTLTMTGNNTYTGATSVNASTLIVNGSLASTVSVTNGGILAGNGSTGGFVSTGGIIAPGNSIGTLNINGNFTQNGGTYVVEVNAQGQNDRVNVNGTATINGAAVQVVATPGNYATSTTYTILNATGGVSGTYTGVTSNYAFLTPSLSYNTNNVFLTLALQGSTPFSGFGGNTANQQAVGSALDQSYANATGDFATVIGALANLSTTQASPTLNTISGQPYANFGTFNVANNALFMNALGQQMALARGGASNGQRQALAEACDIAACDGASPFSVWGSVLGGLGSVQGNGNSSTFTYNAGGSAAGIDYRVSPSVLVGLGAGFTSGTQWVDSFQGKGWANTVSVAAYASFTQSAFYLDALAGYAYSNNQLQRQISVPGLQPRTANGSTGANQFLGQAEAGYKLGVYAPAQAMVTPFARFQASSINQAAFNEWGANSLNLNVAQQTTTSIRSVLGAELAGAVGLGNTRTLDLGLRLGWMHEYADTARPMTAAFAGAPTANFTVYGATPQRDSAVIGFRAGTEVAAGAQLYLRYDGEVGATANNHTLNLGVRLQW
ncbi:MAG: autotransporter-associated beta strand repeat-containing protein [Reyranella sp.]|nr:autotransporter-associated beta strand repeat-containing protein [Reyranella sp.]